MSNTARNSVENAAFKAWISGIVQGVGYRYFAYREASAFEIGGYVKNLADGRVEVYAEGPRDQLEKFLERLRIGPRFGHVEDVEIEWLEYQPRFKRFIIESGY